MVMLAYAAERVALKIFFATGFIKGQIISVTKLKITVKLWKLLVEPTWNLLSWLNLEKLVIAESLQDVNHCLDDMRACKNDITLGKPWR